MKIRNHTKQAVLCVTALLLAEGASPANARTAQERSTTVKTSDIDLNSQLGRKLLDRRIRRAARIVCPKKPGSLIPEQACVKQAEETAWQTVRSRQLQAKASTESPSWGTKGDELRPVDGRPTKY